MDVVRQEAAFDSLREDYKQKEVLLTKGKTIADRVKIAEGWFPEHRPPVMGCLRDLTLAFPPDARIIANALNFHDSGRVTLGASPPEQIRPIILYDSLTSTSARKSFSDVDMPSQQEAAGRTKEAAFSINFTYKGQE